MNPKSLENLKKNGIIQKYGLLGEGQVSYTIRVRLTPEVKELIKTMSPQKLGRIITEALDV